MTEQQLSITIENLAAEIATDDGSIHTGIFRGTIPVAQTDVVVAKDAKLQAMAGDFVRVRYLDKLNITSGPRDLSTRAKCVEGNLGGVRVTRTQITNAGLVQLKGMTKLEELLLFCPKVTDAGLVHLTGLTNLQELGLGSTKVTDAGVADLQKALPNCKIVK